jgi:hypothetical protein
MCYLVSELFGTGLNDFRDLCFCVGNVRVHASSGINHEDHVSIGSVLDELLQKIGMPLKKFVSKNKKVRLS